MDEPEPRPYLAEWWPRVGATLLDSVIVGAISFGCLIVSILALAPSAPRTTGAGRCGCC